MSESLSKYSKLANFGRELLYKTSLTDGLPHISKYAKEIIGADRCSIFMYDSDKQEFWTTLADGIERITIDSEHGLVGETLRAKEAIVENNVYTNQHFLSTIDVETGYRTKSVITAPIFDSNKEILGILQLLNKDGGFDKDDKKFMVFFAHYVSGFLELVNLYEHEGH